MWVLVQICWMAVILFSPLQRLTRRLSFVVLGVLTLVGLSEISKLNLHQYLQPPKVSDNSVRLELASAVRSLAYCILWNVKPWCSRPRLDPWCCAVSSSVRMRVVTSVYRSRLWYDLGSHDNIPRWLSWLERPDCWPQLDRSLFLTIVTHLGNGYLSCRLACVDSYLSGFDWFVPLRSIRSLLTVGGRATRVGVGSKLNGTRAGARDHANFVDKF